MGSMRATGELESILIVGGGTAGWMAAAQLNRILRPLGCTVTLVESPDAGSIGVGEATVPSLVKFVRQMQLEEAEFMRSCSATYKLGIRFLDWLGEGHGYWHPFGICGGVIDGIDLYHFWWRARQSGLDVGPYASYSLQALVAGRGLAPRPRRGGSPILEKGAYAYHVDADGLAGTLQALAVSEGVRHHRQHVSEVVRDARGRIDRIATREGRDFAADLFVDCSGFSGVLIERALGDPWIDWSDRLHCDRAVVRSLPEAPEMLPYTRARALSAGWMWRIPLRGRTGCGYVYSSRHHSDEDAAVELLRRSGGPESDGAGLRTIPMRVGRRSSFWKENCVSVGLSSGFVEPLESTGLYLIQRSIELLLEYLPDRAMSERLRSRYNARMGALYEEVRDFIVLHYLLSRREEPFWRDSRNVGVPDALKAVIELHDENGKVESDRVTLFQEANVHFVFSGCGRNPRRVASATRQAELAKVEQVLGRIREQNEQFARTLPSHADGLHAADAGAVRRARGA